MAMLATIAKPEYNNVITQNAAGSTYAWSASTGVLDANFADTIGTTDSIQIFTQGYQFAWKPDTVNVIDDTDVMTLLENVNPNATAQVWNNKLTYVGTTASTSDEFVVDGNQLKHSVRMVAPPRLPSGFTGTPKYLAIGGDIGTTAQDWASIDLYADGVSHRSDFVTSDDLSFVEISSGKEIYRIPHITIIDDAGNEYNGQYKLVFGANNVVTMYMLCPWDWLQQAQYPIIIDPTVIVSSAYDTSGNGGRKIVHLSNGWIVAGAYASGFKSGYPAIVFYVSKDNGQTWAQLTSVGDVNYCVRSDTGWAMASNGTQISVAYGYDTVSSGVSNGRYYSFTFDATTAASSYVAGGTNGQNNYAYIESLPASFGSGISLAYDNNGGLHVAYVTKENAYPNSYNIRYSKATFAPGTMQPTWASPTQITLDSNSGYTGYTNPCIVVNSSNNPIIVAQRQYPSQPDYDINVMVYSGTAWNATKTIYSGATYPQSNPCVAIDSNGVIHVVWNGNSSSNSSQQIMYAKSTDGGNTWSSPTILANIASGNQEYPTITVDTNNNLYVFFQGVDSSVASSYFNIRYIKYTASSASWGSITTITSDTTASATNPQVLWSEFNMNSSDAIRVIYQDGQASSVEYYTITLNSPPNAPTLTPHGNFDATVAQTLQWTFSDPDAGNTQSAYELQIVDTSNSSVVVDTGKVASTTSSYTLPANTLSQNKNYQWRVATWDNNGSEGPYSAYSTFSTAAAPTVTVTTPASGGTVNSSQLTVQFSYSDPASNAQQSYEVELLQSNDSTVIEDSGTINGTNNAYTLQTVLANNTTYHARVRATNSKGVTSAWSDVSFSTAFTPPAQPGVTLTSDSTHAKISVVLANPTQNLLSANDASFEGGLGDWGAGSNWTIAQDTTYALDGTHSAKGTRSNTTAGNGYISNSWTNVNANTEYTATVSVIGDSTSTGKIFEMVLEWQGGRRTTKTFTVTTSWQQIVITDTSQASETQAHIFITDDPQTTPASGQTIWIDEVMLRQGSDSTWQPSGQPTVSYNDIYRRNTGTSAWTRIATQVAASDTYDDYAVASGQVYDYKVTAYGNNGTQVDSPVVSDSVTFIGDWVYNPSSGQQFQFLYNRKAYAMAITEERKEVQTFGTKPMVRRGPLNARTGTLDALMVKIGTGQTPIQQLQAFEADLAAHNAYYLKTAAGEVFKVDLYKENRSMPAENLNGQAIGVSVNWTEVA